MVNAPVGYKCRQCAKGTKNHIEVITAKQYLIGGLTGFIIGTGTGYIWLYLSMYGALIGFLAAYAVGYCVSRAITASIGTKSGLKIKVFAALITIISIVYNPILVLGYMNQEFFIPFFTVIMALSLSCTQCIIKLLAIVISVWAAVRHFRF